MALGTGLAALLGGQMSTMLEGFNVADLMREVPCAVCTILAAGEHEPPRAVTVLLGTPVCELHGAQVLEKVLE